ncbi:MAG: 16S rRNA (guanine(527)-N(7))-methyltransferase RsmG [Saprospiraceae bacterium]|nr:16S rRNA (guanine(527)-N(7))-methyltransferase RsmG [Saprospiraceae bacterium]
MEQVLKYFNKLSDDQKKLFTELKPLYEFWNAQINVISRKDIDQFYLHHIIHSLSLTRFFNFKPDTKVMDLGCGGGFPGIPLAIYFPKVEFVLIDSIGKKIKVVNEIINELELKNVRAYHKRAEEHKEKFHFVVSRAVSQFNELIQWTRNSFDKHEINALPNGIFAYKGGDLREELLQLKKSNPYEIWKIFDQFEEEFFKQKYIIYVQK